MGTTRPDHPGPHWFTSSHSSGDAECVETAILPGRRLIRDSKLGDASPILTVTAARWHSFLTGLRAGRLDR